MPTSSMWPANITRGLPLGFKTATELPCTSARTSSANSPTSSRHTRPGACSKPDGPAVSSSFFRNPTVLMVTLSLCVSLWCLLPAEAGAIKQESQDREHACGRAQREIDADGDWE